MRNEEILKNEIQKINEINKYNLEPNSLISQSRRKCRKQFQEII